MRQIAEYREFIDKHGGYPARISERRVLLPDGAEVVYDGLEWRFMDPPSDPAASIDRRRTYHEHKLAQSTDHFKRLKAALLGDPSARDGLGHIRFQWDDRIAELYGPPPVGDGKAALRILQRHVEKHTAALDALDQEEAELPQTVEAVERGRQRAALNEAAQRQQAREWAAIQAITIPGEGAQEPQPEEPEGE